MRCFFAFLLATTTTGMSLTSCVADNDANEKSIYDYSWPRNSVTEIRSWWQIPWLL